MDGPAAVRSGRDRRLLVADAVAAVVLAAFCAYTVLDPPGPTFGGPPWVVGLVAAVTALPLAVRRRWPRAVLAVLLVTAVTATATGVVGAGAVWATYVPFVLALYTVATTAGLGWSAAALGLCLLGSAAATGRLYAAVLPAAETGTRNIEVPLFWQVDTGIVWVVAAAAWAVGVVVRWRRTAAARLAAELARTAVTDERLRIARELHDIVGHNLTLIAVKATVANHTADSRPADTRAALGVIEDTSRHALVEVRRVLGVLRSEGDVAPDLGPTPGLAQLPGLAAAARSAGVDVDLRVTGGHEIPEAAGLSVYRIVQESLTNAMTHAAPTRCRVVVTVADDAIDLEVEDDGPASRTARPSRRRPGGGRGIAGMRERVALFGGSLEAGPRPGGGFAVVARLPYREGAPS